MSTTTSTTEHAIHRIEQAIILEAVEGLLSCGYSIDVYDGEGYALKRSHSAAAIMDAMRSTGEDYLYPYNGDRQAGWVHFIYGNDGYDVIADYTISLEMALSGADALADLIASAGDDPYAELF